MIGYLIQCHELWQHVISFLPRHPAGTYPLECLFHRYVRAPQVLQCRSVIVDISVAKNPNSKLGFKLKSYYKNSIWSIILQVFEILASGQFFSEKKFPFLEGVRQKKDVIKNQLLKRAILICLWDLYFWTCTPVWPFLCSKQVKHHVSDDSHKSYSYASI